MEDATRGASGRYLSMARFFATVSALLRLLLSTLQDLIAPPRCAACDTLLRREAVFCGPCAATVTPMHGEGSADYAFAYYEDAIAEAIRRYKFGGRPNLAGPLGELARRALPPGTGPFDVIVPVPLHPARLAERGFNQSALLAKALLKDLPARFEPLALRRSRPTAQQAGLKRKERLSNVQGAIEVRYPKAIAGKRVLLVDDVATTGSTLAACIEVLLEAQARSVHTLVVAQTDTLRQDDRP